MLLIFITILDILKTFSSNGVYNSYDNKIVSYPISNFNFNYINTSTNGIQGAGFPIIYNSSVSRELISTNETLQKNLMLSYKDSEYIITSLYNRTWIPTNLNGISTNSTCDNISDKVNNLTIIGVFISLYFYLEKVRYDQYLWQSRSFGQMYPVKNTFTKESMNNIYLIITSPQSNITGLKSVLSNTTDDEFGNIILNSDNIKIINNNILTRS